MLKDTIDSDLKKALLEGDKKQVEVLRNLKSSILYAEVEQGKKESGLNDSEIIKVLSKESKKRQEAADLYKSADEKDREEIELYQKGLIDKYLPEQMGAEELDKIVDESLVKLGITSPTNQDISKIIGEVKSKVGDKADGSAIAASVKSRISNA